MKSFALWLLVFIAGCLAGTALASNPLPACTPETPSGVECQCTPDPVEEDGWVMDPPE
jgi:hypothetical protein